MEVNSIKKILNLISNLNFENNNLNHEIKKIDYCYELKVSDYTIYFEDIPYEKDKYLEVSYKLSNPISIKLNKKDIKYFRIIFNLLLTNYLRNCKLQNISNN